MRRFWCVLVQVDLVACDWGRSSWRCIHEHWCRGVRRLRWCDLFACRIGQNSVIHLHVCTIVIILNTQGGVGHTTRRSWCCTVASFPCVCHYVAAVVMWRLQRPRNGKRLNFQIRHKILLRMCWRKTYFEWRIQIWCIFLPLNIQELDQNNMTSYWYIIVKLWFYDDGNNYFST